MLCFSPAECGSKAGAVYFTPNCCYSAEPFPPLDLRDLDAAAIDGLADVDERLKVICWLGLWHTLVHAYAIAGSLAMLDDEEAASVFGGVMWFVLGLKLLLMQTGLM
ncbi:hypothetical protein Nepgr_021046 [Nepenthes gracilis]|uniref:Uncharacterized protein n=1 Tax=Nepenthes gracilis TaxID=150966 RepID=A0AAD3SWJ8_NEPGR|nr:hypothetical protein Nepgr_021046 [Nepenthes gracilis]